MYYLINPKPLSLKGKYNNHLTGEETSSERRRMVPKNIQPKSSSVCWTQAGSPDTAKKKGQALHPGRPLRVQLPKQRYGVSWPNLVHWLIHLPGVHSRKGEAKNKGKIASSFFREKKGRPAPPPAWHLGRWLQRVFGCLAASVLPGLRLQRKAPFTRHYWKVGREKQWLITRSGGLCPAAFCRALGILKALVDGLPKCQLFFFF